MAAAGDVGTVLDGEQHRGAVGIGQAVVAKQVGFVLNKSAAPEEAEGDVMVGGVQNTN